MSWLAARVLVSGANPYLVIRPNGAYPFDASFYYPLTAALAALPFSWLKAEFAAAVFFGLGGGLLAYAVLSSGSFRLPLFLSAPFLVATALTQWSPLILAAGMLPGLSWLLACKPNIGIPLFLHRPTKIGIAAIAAFLILSLVVQPSWPGGWWKVIRAGSFHQAPILLHPMGWLLLLALLRIKTPGGRLLISLACLPQSLWFADQLVLWVLPRNRRESWLLTGLSWLAYALYRLKYGWGIPASGEDHPGLLILFLIFIPALVLVIFPEDIGVQAYNILKGENAMNRGQLVLGLVLVVLGVLTLIGTVFQVNVWAFCWPVAFILVGTWLVLRPKLSQGTTASDVVILGDYRRRGKWSVQNSEIWMGVADVDLDFSEAEIAQGETRIKLYGFVGDVDMVFPASVGVAVNAVGFVVDTDLFRHEQKTILAPVEATSPNYATAECKVRVEMIGFVTEMKVKQF